MNFKIFSRLPASGPGDIRSRGERGASSIVFFMMALVFLPVAAMHLAMLFAESGSPVSVGQLAGMVQLLIPGAAGVN